MKEQDPLESLFLPLWKHRWLFAMVAVLCGALGFITARYFGLKYETSAILEIGKVANIKTEDAYLVSSKINSKAFVVDVFGKTRKADEVEKIVEGKMIQAEVVEGGARGGSKYPIFISLKATG
jgi:hypothetical protein